MQQDLGVPIDPAIELVIRLDSAIHADLMADHETGLGPSRDNQITEVAVVGLDVALAGTERETLR